MLQWCEDGRKQSRSLKTTDRAMAEERAEKILAALAARRGAGDDGRISTAAERFVERMREEVSDMEAERARCSLRVFQAWAGDVDVALVDGAMIETYQRTRLRKVSERTWALDQGYIRRMLRAAGLAVEIPDRVRGRRTRVRGFTRDELVRIFTYVTERYRALYATLLVTGARLAEIVPGRGGHVALLKRELRPETNEVLVRTAKRRRGEERAARLIRVPAEVMEMLLLAARSNPGPHVFAPSANAARDFLATMRRAGIARCDELGAVVRLHSFRHTYATMQAATLAPFVLQHALGHRQVSTTQRYVDEAQVAAPVLQLGLRLGPRCAERCAGGLLDGEGEALTS